eukprot:9275267-Pyramimonas_sp.AAC.1
MTCQQLLRLILTSVVVPPFSSDPSLGGAAALGAVGTEAPEGRERDTVAHHLHPRALLGRRGAEAGPVDAL